MSAAIEGLTSDRSHSDHKDQDHDHDLGDAASLDKIQSKVLLPSTGFIKRYFLLPAPLDRRGPNRSYGPTRSTERRRRYKG